MLSSSDKTITILHNLWQPLHAGRRFLRLYLSPWSKLVGHWIYENPRLTDCIFETGDFGDEIRAGMRDKPKIGDDEEGSVRQDPEEWIRTLLFCDTWYWTAAQSTWKMTTTKGFVFIKSDVFIARDAGKQGGSFSLCIKNDSVNFLAYLDWFAKIYFLEKKTHTLKLTNKWHNLEVMGLYNLCPNSTEAESSLRC